MGKTLVVLGLNQTVAALSVARLADAIGNGILLIVIPLYVAMCRKRFGRKAPEILIYFTCAPIPGHPPCCCSSMPGTCDHPSLPDPGQINRLTNNW